MARLARACLALLSALLVAPWAAAEEAPPTFAMVAPRLAVGDFHEYVHASPSNGTEAATRLERREVYGNGSMEVEGRPARVLLVRTTVRPTDGSGPDAVAESVLRAEDLATVLHRADVEGEAVETRYDPPCAEQAPYPLAAGYEKEGLCASVPDERSPGVAYAWSAEVLRRETIDVPAGRFDAFVVRSSIDGGALVWFAPSACGVVRMTNESESPTPFTIELQQFRCRDTEARASPAPATMTYGDMCGAFPGARCTPAPGALLALTAVAAVALLRRRG